MQQARQKVSKGVSWNRVSGNIEVSSAVSEAKGQQGVHEWV